MKKDAFTQIRLPEDLKKEFASACADADIKQSEALRQLVRAAVDYIRSNRNRWYTPRLVADSPESARQTKEEIAILAQSDMRATDSTRLLAAESHSKYKVNKRI